MDIPETDWKTFRRLREVALDRFFERVLDEAQRLTADPSAPGSKRDRYYQLYDLVKQREKELAGAFDDLRRSTALVQIGIIHALGLWTDEEIEEFSDQARAYISLLTHWNQVP